MHRLVLILVESHSKVGDVSPALVSRVLQGLIEGVTEEALKCFQRIPKYGTGGMLTVSLQIQLEHRAEVHRPRSRLNSSTKALASTLRPSRTTPCPRSTTQSRPRTAVRRALMISTAS
jgi:exocyst complex component 2